VVIKGDTGLSIEDTGVLVAVYVARDYLILGIGDYTCEEVSGEPKKY
jgi:hypothetical protein